MTQQAQLLAEIEAFLATRKMAETTFGRMAVNDGKFVGRLRTGANLTVATIERVRAFIAANRAPREAA
jgi:hypothetical protein